MKKTCPNCHSQMALHGDGYVCPICDTHVPHEPDTIPQHEPSSYDPIPTPEERFHEAAPLPAAEIINHRATSYSRQHLQDRLAQLDQPEIVSPLESSLELMPPPPTEEPAAMQRLENMGAESIHNDPTLPLSSDEDEAADTTPIKPSAYVVRATEPLHAPAHHVPTSESELLAAARALASSSASKPASPDPHDTADRLLISAKSPSKPANPLRKWLMIWCAILLMAASLAGAWFLLRPDSPAPQTSPTPVASVTPAPSKDPAKRDSQRKSDLNSIAIGLEAYHKATGAYPVGVDISILSPLEKTSPPYITRINLDPSSTPGTDIKYSYASDGSSFTLSASLENAQDADAKNGLYIVRNALQ